MSLTAEAENWQLRGESSRALTWGGLLFADKVSFIFSVSICFLAAWSLVEQPMPNGSKELDDTI